jgi:hypothetical protein
MSSWIFLGVIGGEKGIWAIDYRVYMQEQCCISIISEKSFDSRSLQRLPQVY